MTPQRDASTPKKVVPVLGPAALGATTASAAVDMLGWRAALLILAIGAGGINFTNANRIEFVLKHGSTDVVADHEAVTEDHVLVDGLAPASIVDGIVRSLKAAHADPDVQKISYIGGRRFLSLSAVFSGAHGTPTPVSVVLELDQGEFEGTA
jgi:hypothetical protein